MASTRPATGRGDNDLTKTDGDGSDATRDLGRSDDDATDST